MAKRWKRRPDGATWGDFGEDDQLGRLNLVTPEKVKQGIAEVREGRTFCLSLPLDYPGGSVLNPRRFAPRLRPTLRDGQANFDFALERLDPQHIDVVNDDAVLMCLQYSTQWDSLGHVGQRFDADGDGEPQSVFYNGYRGGRDLIGPGPEAAPAADGSYADHVGATALGIDNMARAGVQGRGVLIDLHHHFGSVHRLVGYDDLMQVCNADGVVVETGDMVCLHTGFAQMLLDMGGHPDERVHASHAALDGRDERLLEWISASGLALLIADNYAVEAHPAAPAEGRCAALPLHEHCLFKLGINLGELWYLTELAQYLRAHSRSRFLLTAPPLRLPRAVGSPVTPVATV